LRDGEEYDNDEERGLKYVEEYNVNMDVVVGHFFIGIIL
jgi:hypothetical protein